ncbi:MAG: DNA polymerase III subunit delta [Lachnospiraceae bacterium]|nr:DNA polymerase III subunit delta [Lachnospiraceae bacterium]
MNTFDSIIHQPHIVSHFRTVLETGKIPHAYIIQGEKYSGKEYAAKAFASALLCENRSDNGPCGKCRSCIQFAAGSHPDFIQVTHEKPGVIKVDEIRSQVLDTLEIIPYQGDWKVYMVGEADLLNQEGQNALLKSFEEPPAYAVILLLTVDANALLETLRSRAVILTTQPVPLEEVRRFLREQGVPEERVEVSAAFSRGNLGKAKLLATNEEYEQLVRDALGLVREIASLDAAEIVSRVKGVSEAYKVSIGDYLDILSIYFRDLLVYKAAKDPNALVLKEELPVIRQMARKASYEGIEEILTALDNTVKRIKANVNFELAVELLLLTIRERVA